MKQRLVKPPECTIEQLAFCWMIRLWEVTKHTPAGLRAVELMKGRGIDTQLITIAEALMDGLNGRYPLPNLEVQYPVKSTEASRSLSQIMHLDTLGYFRNDQVFSRTAGQVAYLMRTVRTRCLVSKWYGQPLPNDDEVVTELTPQLAA